MIAVKPDKQEGFISVTYAKDQPEYSPLPGLLSPDGMVITEWELTAMELAHLMCGGKVRLYIQSFNGAIQPVRLETVEANES